MWNSAYRCDLNQNLVRENLKLNCVFSSLGEVTSYRNFCASSFNIYFENIVVQFKKKLNHVILSGETSPIMKGIERGSQSQFF